MKKFLLIAAGLIIAGTAAYFYFKSPTIVDKAEALTYTVQKGPFILSVKATGELQAKNSKRIMGPTGMQQIGIYSTVIENIVPEGTVVKKGEFIASLNRNDLANKLTEVSTELDRVMTQLEQARIDTAIDLRGLRDQINNLKFQKREKELQVQQSRYEPEMVIRQSQLELERTDRDLDQTRENLKLKERQAKAKIDEINTLLRQQQNKLKQLNDVADGFTIYAPEDGMVIYTRTWNGKIAAGSQLNGWDPVVAELPDLSDMITKSYVNEVDINKIRPGLDVNVKVDALPDREYVGKVIKVANVGEELRGFDSKVFEIIIQILEVDSLMRPSMTTGAEIFVDDYEQVLSIPIDGLFVDSLSFVYKLKGSSVVKQEVLPGTSSDMMVIIDHGLEEGDVILLSLPENAETVKTEYIDGDIKEQVFTEQEEAKKKRQAAWAEKAAEAKQIATPDQDEGGGGRGGVRIIMN